MVASGLHDFLRQHCLATRIAPRPAGEAWPAMIERISVPGRVAEIDEETYWYFLEVLPPMAAFRNGFAFAEGAEAIRLFWKHEKRHLTRQLTWDETVEFCRLAGINPPS